MTRLIDITGMNFGRLTAVECVRRGGIDKVTGKQKLTLWRCQCDCGSECFVTSNDLRTGHTKSCGCYRADVHTKHGLRGVPEYESWSNMVQRTTNPNHDSYPRYGGRGITIDPRWVDSFAAFISDIGRMPNSNMSIERKDTNEGYWAWNCIWADDITQANNRRNNRIVEFNGVKQSLAMWCRQLDLFYRTVRTRLDKGWSVVRALTTPTPRRFQGTGIIK